MKRSLASRCQAGVLRRSHSFRPQLEALEERLQPGDAVFSGLAGLSLSGSSLSARDQDTSVLESAFTDVFPAVHRQTRLGSLSTQELDGSAAARALSVDPLPLLGVRIEDPSLHSSGNVGEPGNLAARETAREPLHEGRLFDLAALTWAPAHFTALGKHASLGGSGRMQPLTVAAGATRLSDHALLTALATRGRMGMADALSFPAGAHGLSLQASASPETHAAADLAVAPASPSKAARLEGRYGQLPLSFEANQGQADASVQFLSRGNGYTLLLSPHEAVMNLRQPTASRDSHAATEIPAAASSAVHMQLVGANAAPQGTGLQELPGKVHYVGGKDPRQWHTNVPTYARVEYENVYAGINLVYYGSQRQLEYDFVVAPSADPRTIALSFKGADGVEVDAQGDLVVHSAAGSVVQHKPVVYQETDGVRQEISAGYLLHGQQVGFYVAAYDTSRPLVIDPTVVYSTYFGGPGTDEGRGIAADEAGNAYVTGVTDIGSGPIAFVVKLDPTGSALVYAALFSSPSAGFGIAVDDAGNAYVAGLGPEGGGSAFVAKFDPAGMPVYNTFLPGPSVGFGIAVDSSGSAYVTGAADDGGSPVGFVAKVDPTGTPVYDNPMPGTFVGTGIAVDGNGSAYVTGIAADGMGGQVAFGAKVKPDGSALDYGFIITGTVAGLGIAVDSAGSAYLTGAVPHGRNQTDAFAIKVEPDGSAFDYGVVLTAGFGTGIAVDSDGNAYVTGGAAFVTREFTVFQAFITKLDPSGSRVYGILLRGSRARNPGLGIAVDGSHNAYVTGMTNSTDFTTVNALFGTYGGGDSDAFIAKISDT